VTKSVETASNLPMPLVLLPFLSSGFVPTESMPTGLRWFAEHQHFTPIIETIRGLLLGTAIGTSAVLTIAWCDDLDHALESARRSIGACGAAVSAGSGHDESVSSTPVPLLCGVLAPAFVLGSRR
jgi:hypothetical protein